MSGGKKAAGDKRKAGTSPSRSKSPGTAGGAKQQVLLATPKRQASVASDGISPAATPARTITAPSTPAREASSSVVVHEHDLLDGCAEVQPSYWRVVDFVKTADRELTVGENAVLADIEEHYAVPRDFLTNKVTFGPLAGLTGESRLFSAYYLGQLPLKAEQQQRKAAGTGSGRRGSRHAGDSDDDAVPSVRRVAARPPLVCRECAAHGHGPDACPAVFANPVPGALGGTKACGSS